MEGAKEDSFVCLKMLRLTRREPRVQNEYRNYFLRIIELRDAG
jgi:hypothetical protein